MIYGYDPFGRRITKNVNGTITTYVYDNQNIIAEYDQTGSISAKYTHGPGIDEPLAVQQTTVTYYYHADGLGSITALTNASGTVVQTYSYDSFGNMTTTGNINQPFTFTAREYDQETGLYFYRARYYDSKAGKFITKDPIGFAGGDVNLFAYVKNNPVNFIDPKGLACKSRCVAIWSNSSEEALFNQIATYLEPAQTINIRCYYSTFQRDFVQTTTVTTYICIHFKDDPCNKGACVFDYFDTDTKTETDNGKWKSWRRINSWSEDPISRVGGPGGYTECAQSGPNYQGKMPTFFP